MKKRNTTILTIAILTFLSLAGCGKEEVNNNTNNTEGGLEGKLGIPESCDISIDVGESGLESIIIKDDAIEFPLTDQMSVVYYTGVTIDDKYKQTLVETLFDKDEGIYEYDYGNRIKSEVEKELTLLRDTQASIEAEGADASFYDKYIADLEIELQNAPKEYPLTTNYSCDAFLGTLDGNQYIFSISHSVFEDSPAIHAYLTLYDVFAYRPCDGATGVSYFRGSSIDDFVGINVCEMTEEEAVDVAEDFLFMCGVADVLYSDTCVLEWDYFVESTGEDIATEYDGYVISFSRAIDNIPAYRGDIRNVENLIANASSTSTYTSGSSVIHVESTSFEIPVESYTIYVNDNGIIAANWTMIYEASGEEERNVDLLSWDEMLSAANINIGEYYKKYPSAHKKIVFNDIQLSYYPVIDEKKDDSYQYIPVWIFSEYEEYRDSDESIYPTQLVIINAMDGTVIDLLELAKAMGTYQE